MKDFGIAFLVPFLYFYQSTACTVKSFNGTVYALCNGVYTYENATEACYLNGYSIAQFGSLENDTIFDTVSNNFYSTIE